MLCFFIMFNYKLLIYESENNYEKVPDMPRFAPFRRQFKKNWGRRLKILRGGAVVLRYASAYNLDIICLLILHSTETSHQQTDASKRLSRSGVAYCRWSGL